MEILFDSVSIPENKFIMTHKIQIFKYDLNQICGQYVFTN